LNIDLKVVKVVVTSTLNHSLGIASLPKLFPKEAVHNKEVYNGRVAYFKSNNMELIVTLFPSRKMISVGTKSTENAIRELNLVAERLKSGLTEPIVRNIVAVADLGHGVDLERIISLREIRYMSTSPTCSQDYISRRFLKGHLPDIQLRKDSDRRSQKPQRSGASRNKNKRIGR